MFKPSARCIAQLSRLNAPGGYDREAWLSICVTELVRVFFSSPPEPRWNKEEQDAIDGLASFTPNWLWMPYRVKSILRNQLKSRLFWRMNCELRLARARRRYR